MTRTMTTEEKGTAALKYFDEHATPDQSLCPELIQYFKTSKGQMIWSNKTGKREYKAYAYGKSPRNLCPVRSSYNGLYVHYVPELDALEFAAIWLTGNRGKDGEKRYWNFYNNNRYLIFHNDTNAYRNCSWTPCLIGDKYYCKKLISFISDIPLCLTAQGSVEELKKFNGGQGTNNQYGNQEWPYSWQYADWYRRSFMPRTFSKKSNTVLGYELEDLQPQRSWFKNDSYHPRATVYQKLNDDYCVLRVYERYDGHYDWRNKAYDFSENMSVREKLRIFINAKGKPTTVCIECGKWSIKSNVGYWNKGSLNIINYNEALNWKPLKYTLPILDPIDVDGLLAVLRHPIVEQLAKAGYPETAKLLIGDGQVNANMKQYFRVDKPKKLPMYKLLGVNKYILKAFEENEKGEYKNHTIVLDIKRLYDKFDVSDLSEDTVNLLFKGFGSEHYSRLNNWLINGCSGYGWYYRHNCEVTDADRKIILKLFRMSKDNQGLMQLWSDTLSTYRYLSNKPDIDLTCFHNANDIQRMHDAFVQLKVVEDAERAARYNEQRRKELERYTKDFEKRQKDRIEKFEYENDQDDFVIRVPHELVEITKEGTVLHHCVGGYVHSHAQGSTNIVFLRRKDNPEIPFYTIEIKNDTVIQIHGSHNRWLGNNPEAVPFVYRYLTDHGFRFDKNMLLNKGAGYSAGAKMLPETALYAVSA